jgi:hypothetical protein
MFDPGRAFAIPRDRLDKARPWLMPFLAKFEQRVRRVSAEEIFRQAETAEAQLWSYFDGARYRGVIATRIQPEVDGPVCCLWACYGLDGPELYEGMTELIGAWAASEGCVALGIVGRKGWARVLPKFKPVAVVLRKSLEKR